MSPDFAGCDVPVDPGHRMGAPAWLDRGRLRSAPPAFAVY